jgi:hypothetical protein
VSAVAAASFSSWGGGVAEGSCVDEVVFPICDTRFWCYRKRNAIVTEEVSHARDGVRAEASGRRGRDKAGRRAVSLADCMPLVDANGGGCWWGAGFLWCACRSGGSVENIDNISSKTPTPTTLPPSPAIA